MFLVRDVVKADHPIQTLKTTGWHQLTAEKAVKRWRHGIQRTVYIKILPRNEAHDLGVLNLTNFAMLNVNTEKVARRFEEINWPESHVNRGPPSRPLGGGSLRSPRLWSSLWHFNLCGEGQCFCLKKPIRLASTGSGSARRVHTTSDLCMWTLWIGRCCGVTRNPQNSQINARIVFSPLRNHLNWDLSQAFFRLHYQHLI